LIRAPRENRSQINPLDFVEAHIVRAAVIGDAARFVQNCSKLHAKAANPNRAHDVAGRSMPGEPEFSRAAFDCGNDLVGDVLLNVEAFVFHDRVSINLRIIAQHKGRYVTLTAMSQAVVAVESKTVVVASRDGVVVPRVIAAAGDQAARRFLEFFAATIRNKNTRMAYYRACRRFFAWCDQHRIGEIADIEPLHVAAHVEAMARDFEKPTVKQHLAAIRMLFDWLVTGQVVATNPAHSVRGPKHVVKTGKTRC
jgi:hypothetical protein